MLPPSLQIPKRCETIFPVSLCPDSPTLVGTESCTGQIRHPEQNSSDPWFSPRANTSARQQVTRQDGHPFQRTRTGRSAAGGTTCSAPVRAKNRRPRHRLIGRTEILASTRCTDRTSSATRLGLPLRCRREVEPPPLFALSRRESCGVEYVHNLDGRTADEGRAKGWPAGRWSQSSQSLSLAV